MSNDKALEWRCFHCNEVFTNPKAARDHFGVDSEYQPGCIDELTLDQKAYRSAFVGFHVELDATRNEVFDLQDQLASAHEDLFKLRKKLENV